MNRRSPWPPPLPLCHIWHWEPLEAGSRAPHAITLLRVTSSVGLGEGQAPASPLLEALQLCRRDAGAPPVWPPKPPAASSSPPSALAPTLLTQTTWHPFFCRSVLSQLLLYLSGQRFGDRSPLPRVWPGNGHSVNNATHPPTSQIRWDLPGLQQYTCVIKKKKPKQLRLLRTLAPNPKLTVLS